MRKIVVLTLIELNNFINFDKITKFFNILRRISFLTWIWSSNSKSKAKTLLEWAKNTYSLFVLQYSENTRIVMWDFASFYSFFTTLMLISVDWSLLVEKIWWQKINLHSPSTVLNEYTYLKIQSKIYTKERVRNPKQNTHTSINIFGPFHLRGNFRHQFNDLFERAN